MSSSNSGFNARQAAEYMASLSISSGSPSQDAGPASARSPPPPPPPPTRRPPPVPPTTEEPEQVNDDLESFQTRSSILHSTRHSLPRQNSKSVDSSELTPLRAHYLKKTLINLEVERELTAMSNPALGGSALGLLGPPFVDSPPVIPLVGSTYTMASGAAMSPQQAAAQAQYYAQQIQASQQAAEAKRAQRGGSASISQEERDLPFLRFMFHQFLLPFPFLAAAPPTFWSHKIQPFLTCFLAISQNRINPATGSTGGLTLMDDGPGKDGTTAVGVDTNEPDFSLWTAEEVYEYKERKKIWDKAQKVLGMLFASGVKVAGGEEVVRIGQKELSRLEEEGAERRKRWLERERSRMGFEVNVICVRTVVEKMRMRSKSHDEFIICTKRTGSPDVLVSRRYGDFKRLADELRAQFPDTPLPLPPPKDRTSSATAASQAAAANASGGYSAYNPMRMIYGSGSSASPASGTSSPKNPPAGFTEGHQGADTFDASNLSTPLAREKNRLTLRAYLNAILAVPSVLNSPILRSFLLSAPTSLTPAEAMDAQRRAEADAVREEGRRRFQKEAEKRVEALREGLSEFKGDILGKKGGLKDVFEVVRRVENVRDLPRAEASVLEWGRISLAATIFQLFVASDNASETFSQLKRIHGMLPYFMLKGILKVSNPMAMIRGVLDLFLARPFGGQSLLQRMFSSSLTEDVRLLQEDINTMYERIDDPIMCQKIENYVNAPYEIQEMFRTDAATEKLDLIAVILRSQEMPSLNRSQVQRVIKANRAYKQYKSYQADLDDSDDDEGPQNEDAWLFEDLHLLLKLMVRKREKEQLVGLIFEGLTAELLKDIITIFYTPLATVYKAASIADSLGDLQTFVNDLIKTVEAVEELAQDDPSATVQTFIDLVARHEQSFYTFVHRVHRKGEGLFDSIMDWVELFLTFAREGLPHDVDVECLLPYAGEERIAILKEVDSVAAYHYKLKLAYEEKVRRRFQKEGGTDEESALIDSVIAGLNIDTNAVREDADEIGDDDDSSDEDEDLEFEEAFGSDRSTVAWRTKGSDEASLASNESHKLAGETQSKSSLRHSIDFVKRNVPGSGSASGSTPESPDGTQRRAPAAPKYKKINRKGKGKRDIIDVGEPPVLRRVPLLTPLFVEMIRPMLVVRQPAAQHTPGR